MRFILQRKLILWFFLTAFLVAGTQFIFSSSKILLRPIEGDYEMFYLSGKAVWHGNNPYLVWGLNGSFMRNPPPTLLLLSFLSFFPPQLSQFFFFISSLLSVYLGVILLLKFLCGLDKTKKITLYFWQISFIFLFLITIFFPFRYTLGSGHINGYLFLIFSAALYYFFRKKDFLVGILVSIGASLIITPAFLGLIFLIRKRFMAIWGFIFGLIILNSLTLGLFGLKVYSQYLKTTGSYFDFTVNNYYNQSLVASLSRLSLSLQTTPFLLLIIVSCIFFLIFIWQKKVSQSKWIDLILWNLAILFTIIFVTSSWQYYFIIALIPLMTSLFIIYSSKAPVKLYLLILLSYILMGINIKTPEVFLNKGVLGMVILSHVCLGALLLFIVNIYLLFENIKTSQIRING